MVFTPGFLSYISATAYSGLLVANIWTSATTSVVDPNTLNLDPDPDPGFWPNLNTDPDPW